MKSEHKHFLLLFHSQIEALLYTKSAKEGWRHDERLEAHGAD